MVVAMATLPVLNNCGGGTAAPSQQVVTASPAVEAPVPEVAEFEEGEEGAGLVMDVTSWSGPPSIATDRVEEGEWLSDEASRALLDRAATTLPETAQAPWAMRESSRRPPAPGQRVELSVSTIRRPPPSATNGPLTVVQAAPRDRVNEAPDLRVTFSQPMVAVGTQAQVEQNLPVQLTPQPPGQWQWLGTRTITFRPTDRFPMATDYEAIIPAGIAGVDGERLKEKFRFSFSTPPPTMTQMYPTGDGRGLDEVIFIAFDQRIDPAAMGRYVKLGFRGQQVPLRPATEAEIENSPVHTLVDHAQEGQWLALRVERPLPAATEVVVFVDAGAPSAEGPGRTRVAQTFSFSTFGPFRVTHHQCGFDDTCAPDAAWTVDFSNEIDLASFSKDNIIVTPPVAELVIDASGQTISLDGLKNGRTTYKVEIPASLRDVHGQKLSKPVRVQFKTGSIGKNLFGPEGELLTLSPSATPRMTVYSVNHNSLKVTLHAVTPTDYPAWRNWADQRWNEESRHQPLPGRRLFDKTVRPDGLPDAITPVAIDLQPYLKDGTGHFVLKVEPVVQAKESWNRQEVSCWIQVTSLGLSAFADGKELVAFVTRLKDGAPVDGARIQLLNDGAAVAEMTSDAQGLGVLALPGIPGGDVLVARTGSDAVLVPGGWQAFARQNRFGVHLFDDRGIYRPGETVWIKGYVRKLRGDEGDVPDAQTKVAERVNWTVSDPRGNPLSKGSAPISENGGFHLKTALPDDVHTGNARVEVEVDDPTLDTQLRRDTHAFQIAEFRTPEFAVSTGFDEGVHILGGRATASVAASYYAGGPLLNAPVTWHLQSVVADYSPPGWSDWHFGPYLPFWRCWEPPPSPSATVEKTGTTDATGTHGLDIRFRSLDPVRPMLVTARATVQDVNRQMWSSSSQILVHPSRLYAGLRLSRNFIEVGDQVALETAVVDIDGNRVTAAQGEVRLTRVEGRGWNGDAIEVARCALGREYLTECRFSPDRGGLYVATATVKDRAGRPNRSEMRFFVTGGAPVDRMLETDRVVLVPQKEEWAPGDVAKVLVQSPFYPSDGVLTLRRGGLLHRRVLRLTRDTIVSINIVERHVPQVTLQVDLVGAAVGRDGGDSAPAAASGTIALSVPATHRRLEVEVSAAEKVLRPGSTTDVHVTVTDPAGRPVKDGEVTVFAVDEAVLALTGYTLKDPVETFYRNVEDGVQDVHSRAWLRLADDAALAAAKAQMTRQTVERVGDWADGDGSFRGNLRVQKSSPGGRNGGARDKQELSMALPLANATGTGSAATTPVAVRSNFSPLALFAPRVMTAADGTAQVEMTLPDSLTRYRIMAVVADGKNRFGRAESAVTAKLPLMVRPSAPRFLHCGDRFLLPVVLQNQTEEDMWVDVAVRADNLRFARTLPELSKKAFLDAPGRRVRVPAGDRLEVRFPAASQKAGRATVQIMAATEGFADAVNVVIPVWTPGTTEAFATYGQVDQGATAAALQMPGDVHPEFGGLEVTTSSTQLQALTDAFLYLVEYPYECSEQLASKILSIAALKDVLTAFDVPGMPTPAELETMVNGAIATLAGRQGWDNGFGLWRANESPWPYVSIYVAMALQTAKDKGFKVSDDTLSRVSWYLKNIDSHIPGEYSAESRQSLRAFALHVRHRMGDTDMDGAARLLSDVGVEKMPMESLGWLLPVVKNNAGLTEQILRRGANSATLTASAAHFTTAYPDGARVLFHSDRRVDGIWLHALIEVTPTDELIPMLVRGLLAGQVQGRWQSTQENAFVLLALDRYFATFEKVSPDFVARLWLGKNYAEHTFRGRTTDQAVAQVPMKQVLAGTDMQSLILQKDGAGRMYYRIALNYSPSDLMLPASDHGFAVSRVYEPVDDDEDVRRQKDGSWLIRAGCRVRVRVTMETTVRRYHVALVDPLPAGFEAVNPDVAVEAAPSMTGNGPGWFYHRNWFEHQNLRDERAEAFASGLWEGVVEYTYVAKATTPGEFLAPPAKAEEMYTPETFGRSATDKVIVR